MLRVEKKKAMLDIYYTIHIFGVSQGRPYNKSHITIIVVVLIIVALSLFIRFDDLISLSFSACQGSLSTSTSSSWLFLCQHPLMVDKQKPMLKAKSWQKKCSTCQCKEGGGKGCAKGLFIGLSSLLELKLLKKPFLGLLPLHTGASNPPNRHTHPHTHPHRHTQVHTQRDNNIPPKSGWLSGNGVARHRLQFSNTFSNICVKFN